MYTIHYLLYAIKATLPACIHIHRARVSDVRGAQHPLLARDGGEPFLNRWGRLAPPHPPIGRCERWHALRDACLGGLPFLSRQDEVELYVLFAIDSISIYRIKHVVYYLSHTKHVSHNLKYMSYNIYRIHHPRQSNLQRLIIIIYTQYYSACKSCYTVAIWCILLNVCDVLYTSKHRSCPPHPHTYS